MSTPGETDLIYDWNTVDGTVPRRPIEFDDETLRDGLQSPSVKDPTIDQKVGLLHLMDKLGIHTADVGLPGAGPMAVEAVDRLVGEIVSAKLSIKANCAARTLLPDIEPIAKVSQKHGIPVEACLFIGSSPIRQYAEIWTLEKMLDVSKTAIEFAHKQNLPVMYVTEDTTRAHPDTLKALFRQAVDLGVKRLCLCDTCGHATPAGTRALIRWTQRLLDEWKATDVVIDWHGHRDRGQDIANALAAYDAGVARIHGTALGVGERVGNVPMDTLLVNLKLMGVIDNDLTALAAYCELAHEATGVPYPRNWPVFGEDAFETGSGVHAAAVIKAFKKGDNWLADRVYSGVPAGDFGLRQKIRIGPMSGRSNVVFWLEQRGMTASEDLVDAIFAKAKKTPTLLTDSEIEEVVAAQTR
jgi:2-isopropylmalate synthase